MTNTLHPHVIAYLRDMELAIKQLSGVHPEEALSDAREHLESFVGACDGKVSNEELPHLLIEEFGTPEEVALQYGEVAEPGWERNGYAPGWRVCCCTCGRSKPADKSGMVRMLASSREKYVGGFCSHCRWFRWLRVIKDLDRTNLTDQLCLNLPAEATLRRAHHPWRLALLILAGVAAINVAVWAGILLFTGFLTGA